MNIVPHVAYGPVPVVERVLEFARRNPAVVAEARRLIRNYGPAAVDYARNAGYQVGRLVRQWFRNLPRRNHFMQRVRTGLARQQDFRAVRDARDFVRRQYRGSRRIPTIHVAQSEKFVQRGRGSRGMGGSRRGGYGMRRGGGALYGPRYRIRRGGRPITYGGLRPELKNIDQAAVALAVANTIVHTSSPISTITQGSASNQRVGKKILAKSFLIAGRVYSTGAPVAANADDTVWIWIVLDRQANGTNGLSVDVWNPNTGHNALRNLDSGPRFKILKCLEIKVAYGQVGVFVNQPFESMIKLNLPVSYIDTGGTIPRKNNILVFAGTSQPGASNLALDYNTRVRFYDA